MLKFIGLMVLLGIITGRVYKSKAKNEEGGGVDG